MESENIFNHKRTAGQTLGQEHVTWLYDTWGVVPSVTPLLVPCQGVECPYLQAV